MVCRKEKGSGKVVSGKIIMKMKRELEAKSGSAYYVLLKQ